MKKVFAVLTSFAFVSLFLVAPNSQASTPQSKLTTCTNLINKSSTVLKATQRSCRDLLAPAIWHIAQSDSPMPTGAGYKTIRVCTSKNPEFTYQYLKTKCAGYLVTTDYWRATTAPVTPIITSSSAIDHQQAQLSLETPASSDSPIAYYLVKNLSTGLTTQVSPAALNLLRISGLQATTSYSFAITAVSIDGISTTSTLSKVITTGAAPVVHVAPVVPATSSDATLSALSITTATISPVFAAATTSYTSTVANGVSSVTLTPTVNESHATITVNGTAVTSGAASGAISLSIGANTITTVVTAQNATTNTYTVVITRTGANDTTIATFSFAALTPVVTGTVDNTAHTVALTVPYGTSPTALVSTFSIGTGASAKVGASDQVSATTANDFTNPVNYTITAQDGVTTQTYAVTVTVTHSSPTVTAVSVSSGAQAGGTAITITGTVFVTGATVTIGGTAATSVTVVSSTSITATTPAHAPGIVNIVVTNPDTGFGTGTNLYTFNYVVGDRGPGGGIVFYVSAGFTSLGSTCNTTCKYLEAAPTSGTNGWTDATYAWSGNVNVAIGTSGTAIGTGYANTLAIVQQADGGTAAEKAGTKSRAYGGPNNLTDWFLPSKDELNQMCKWARGVAWVSDATVCTGGAINTGSGASGFVENFYWSSSEFDASNAWVQSFANGVQGFSTKDSRGFYVRPIRVF